MSCALYFATLLTIENGPFLPTHFWQKFDIVTTVFVETLEISGKWQVSYLSIFPLLFLQNNPFSVANSKYNFHQNDYVRANALKALSRQSIYKVMSCFNIEAVQRIEESSPMTFIQTELPCLPGEITPLLHLFELTLKASPAGKARTMCPYSGCC